MLLKIEILLVYLMNWLMMSGWNRMVISYQLCRVKEMVLSTNVGPVITKMWQKCDKNSQKTDKNVTKDCKQIVKGQLIFEKQKCDRILTKIFGIVTKNWQKAKMYLKCDKSHFKNVSKNWQKIFFCYIFVTFLFQERPSINHQRPTKATNNSKNVTKMWQKQQKPPLCRRSSS